MLYGSFTQRYRQSNETEVDKSDVARGRGHKKMSGQVEDGKTGGECVGVGIGDVRECEHVG
uniref:Uncharacterized protein n=1 Tax=Setaria digitata TaxID=48799 RepID=A0A915PV72_9BILA